MSLLDKAKEVREARNAEYGPGVQEIQRVVNSYNAMYGNSPMTPTAFGFLMCCIKLARENTTSKEDNFIDAINYLDMAWEAREPEGGHPKCGICGQGFFRTDYVYTSLRGHTEQVHGACADRWEKHAEGTVWADKREAKGEAPKG